MIFHNLESRLCLPYSPLYLLYSRARGESDAAVPVQAAEENGEDEVPRGGRAAAASAMAEERQAAERRAAGQVRGDRERDEAADPQGRLRRHRCLHVRGDQRRRAHQGHQQPGDTGATYTE